MNLNVGTIDQAIRIIAGLALVLLAFLGVVGAWGYLGILIAATGIVRFCPAYTLFGFSTRGKARGGVPLD